MGRIVIGVDGSSGAEHALRWAVEEADVHGWQIRPVMAFSYVPESMQVPSARAVTPSLEEVERRTREIVSLAGRGVPGASPVEGQTVEHGRPADVIVEAGEDADLIVVGSRGIGGFRGLLLGSVSREVATRAPVPVAVVPEGAPIGQETGHVVVGVDDSDHASAALRWAASEADARGGALDVVHVASPAPLIASGGAATEMMPVDMLKSSARHLAERMVDRVLGPDRDDVATHGRVGHPAEQLLRAANSADLLVVGTRGRRRTVAALLGSTSGACLNHAARPTVIVPHHQR